MKYIAKILVALVALGTVAQAQTLKVGIVNMQEVLQGYYKSKQAQVDLNQRRDDIKKDLDVRRTKLRDLTREVEDLQKLIRDESTTAEFRRLKMQELENKASEGRALQRDLEQLAGLGRSWPDGEVIGLRVGSTEEAAALVQAEPETFFTIPHFDGYPAVLVRLDRIDLDYLSEVLVDAWVTRVPQRVAHAWLAEHGLT